LRSTPGWLPRRSPCATFLRCATLSASTTRRSSGSLRRARSPCRTSCRKVGLTDDASYEPGFAVQLAPKDIDLAAAAAPPARCSESPGTAWKQPSKLATTTTTSPPSTICESPRHSPPAGRHSRKPPEEGTACANF
jgi:hypothetical protein